MQNNAADHLHIEVAHAGRALARFADQGKRLRQDFIQRVLLTTFAIVFVGLVLDRLGNLLFEAFGALPQLVIGKRLDLRFPLVNLPNNWTNALQKSLVTAAKNFG